MTTTTDLDAFTRAYLECILWAETDHSDDSGGDPLDENYSLDDFDPASLKQAIYDCRRFQEENAADIALYDHQNWTAAELGGHDFWLTRNGHGCGFWDRNDFLPADAGNRLTAASEEYGECYVTVGDDGKLYIDSIG
jgi:hypothetical protein